MKNSDSRVLEVRVISAEDLSVNRRQPLKKNAFVVIKSEAQKIEAATTVDKDGGSYPSWDEKFSVDMPMHSRYLTAEVRCRGGAGGDRLIGSAKIPVTDFLGGLVPENYLHFLSYRLWDYNGERNGIINLSVRVVKGSPAAKVGFNAGGASCSSTQPWAGVPVADKVSSGGTVTGIPVW
ncbi:OLC1v1039119C1 [Oldenlandia corymbosa var. corymbosa]|uniref:OLC1v1039119C1 n=1 Tax=Oldenlandia corymbosa var. corymbosa TaxID=529605 RepID=A0AAV1D519_OLDCO|nr:OLC1v1039119C1 [Oldenlandia corymbosa var. corymbosa]